MHFGGNFPPLWPKNFGMSDLSHFKRSLTRKFQLIVGQYEDLGISIEYFLHKIRYCDISPSKILITAILGKNITILTQNLGKEIETSDL